MDGWRSAETTPFDEYAHSGPEPSTRERAAVLRRLASLAGSSSISDSLAEIMISITPYTTPERCSHTRFMTSVRMTCLTPTRSSGDSWSSVWSWTSAMPIARERNAVVLAAAGGRPPAILAPNGVQTVVPPAWPLVQVESNVMTASGNRVTGGTRTVGVLQEVHARVVLQEPQALVEAHEAPLGAVPVPLARG